MVIELCHATYTTGRLWNRIDLVLLIVPDATSSLVWHVVIEIACFSISAAIICVATLNHLNGAQTS